MHVCARVASMVPSHVAWHGMHVVGPSVTGDCRQRFDQIMRARSSIVCGCCHLIACMHMQSRRHDHGDCSSIGTHAARRAWRHTRAVAENRIVHGHDVNRARARPQRTSSSAARRARARRMHGMMCSARAPAAVGQRVCAACHVQFHGVGPWPRAAAGQ